jgi:phage-related protein
VRRAVGLTVLGVAVVILTRRRWRRQLNAAVRLPAAVAVALLSAPLDVFDDIGGFFGGLAGDVKNFVLEVVRAAFNVLKGITDWLGQQISDLANWVGGAFDAVYAWAASVIDNVAGWVSQVAADIYRWASDAIGAVANLAVGLVNDVIHWAEQAVGALWTGIQDALNWVYDNVLTPLWNLVQWLWHNVVEPAVDWLTNLIGWVWNWVTDAVSWITGIIGQLWDFAFHWALGLLQVVEKALSWLVKLAEHGPEWVVQQVEDAFQEAPEEMVAAFERAAESNGDELEQMFARWIG